MNVDTLLTLESEIPKNKLNFYIYGCSHAKCFVRGHMTYSNFSVYNKGKSSASMSGIVRDKSKLNYKKEVEKSLYKNPNSYHIFKFGQVDVEYIYYHKLINKKQNITKEDFYNTIISKYIKYILEITSRGVKNVIVCGCNMASPYEWKAYVKKILKLNNIPEDMTYNRKNLDLIFFNKILRNYCEDNNIVYFDLTDECTVNSSEGIILKDEYVGKDHHYAGAEMPRPYNKIIKTDLNYGYGTYYTFLQKMFRTIMQG